MDAIGIDRKHHVDAIVNKKTSLIVSRYIAKLLGEMIQYASFKVFLPKLYGADASIKSSTDDINKRPICRLLAIGDEVEVEVNNEGHNG